MAKNNITGQDLARMSGVHWVTISRILNGQVQTTTLEVAEKLLTALRMKPEKLLQKIG
jgi:DNA-binding Xre family transcriptional regulator